MNKLSRQVWLLLCSLLFISQQIAHADIWGYIDERGVAHFSDKKTDDRYELFYKGGESFDTTKTPKGTPEDPPPPQMAAPSVPAKLLTFFEASPNYKAIRPHIKEASNTYKVDYELLQALIAAESGFNVGAVSPKGAIGLMQLMPGTARRYGVEGDKKLSQEQKLNDPKINVRAGTRYLRDLIVMFPGRLDLALASYNAGEGAVIKAGNKIPNYKETQNYVKIVMQLYQGLKPPKAAVAAEKPKMPTRVRMEMLGGASGRRNMLAPIPFEGDPASPAPAGASPNSLPGTSLVDPPPGLTSPGSPPLG